MSKYSAYSDSETERNDPLRAPSPPLNSSPPIREKAIQTRRADPCGHRITYRILGIICGIGLLVILFIIYFFSNEREKELQLQEQQMRQEQLQK